MSDLWIESEPEEGQVAWILVNGQRIGPALCRYDYDNEIPYWEMRCPLLQTYVLPCKWQPIVTPGEDRLQEENGQLHYWIDTVPGPAFNALKARVIDLEAAIVRHKTLTKQINAGHPVGVCPNLQLWAKVKHE
jgi:hypothetical protein